MLKKNIYIIKMKVNKKLKMPMIVFGILLLLAGIACRVVSYTKAVDNNNTINKLSKTSGPDYIYFMTTRDACGVSLMSMRYNLISTLCLLLGLGVITFASRMGQISGIKLMISCLFFIGCITLSVFVQFKLAKLYGNGQGGNYKYCPADIHAQFGRQDDVHPILIHISNGCAIFGITALLL